jgi:hypothetical protein
MKMFGKIFTNGNFDDLIKISEKLTSIGVKYSLGSNIIFFDEIYITLLPKDINGHWIK